VTLRNCRRRMISEPLKRNSKRKRRKSRRASRFQPRKPPARSRKVRRCAGRKRRRPSRRTRTQRPAHDQATIPVTLRWRRHVERLRRRLCALEEGQLQQQPHHANDNPAVKKAAEAETPRRGRHRGQARGRRAMDIQVACVCGTKTEIRVRYFRGRSKLPSQPHGRGQRADRRMSWKSEPKPAPKRKRPLTERLPRTPQRIRNCTRKRKVGGSGAFKLGD